MLAVTTVLMKVDRWVETMALKTVEKTVVKMARSEQG
jgi:hypothetical protein